MSQMEFKKLGKMEKKDAIFFVRCRASIKEILQASMKADGFDSMTDWFEQFIKKSLGTKGGKSGDGDKKRRARAR